MREVRTHPVRNCGPAAAVTLIPRRPPHRLRILRQHAACVGVGERDLTRFGGPRRLGECSGVLPDGRQVISGSADHMLRLWEVASGDSRVLVDGSAVRAVAFSPDGRHVMAHCVCGRRRVGGRLPASMATSPFSPWPLSPTARASPPVTVGDACTSSTSSLTPLTRPPGSRGSANDPQGPRRRAHVSHKETERIRLAPCCVPVLLRLLGERGTGRHEHRNQDARPQHRNRYQG